MSPIQFLFLLLVTADLSTGLDPRGQDRNVSALERFRRQNDGELVTITVSISVTFEAETLSQVEIERMHESKTGNLHLSILDFARLEEKDVSELAIRTGNSIEKPAICEDQSVSGERRTLYKAQAFDAVHRSLNYIGKVLDSIKTQDVIPGLSIIKWYDAKHGGNLEKTHSIPRLANTVCSKSGRSESSVFCHQVFELLGSRSWSQRSSETLQVARMNMSHEQVGHEKDPITAQLNMMCQHELVRNCRVPEECVAFFDPNPSTQYWLSHQLLQRMLAEGTNCEATRPFLLNNVNDQLCAKMYAEAQLIAELGYPESLRDIFGEHVGFCGFAGYPNFFREDWLKEIISWQSQSEYGCFTASQKYADRFKTSDDPVRRPQTNGEMELGKETEELCRLHLTAVNMIAVAGFWDYLHQC